MRLGQKVSFTKSLSRQTGNGVSANSLTDDQKELLLDGDFIKVTRFKERDHNKKVGFIAGKRTITTAVHLMLETDDPYRDHELYTSEWEAEQVFVVACDMQRLFRVRLEDLEVIT